MGGTVGCYQEWPNKSSPREDSPSDSETSLQFDRRRQPKYDEQRISRNRAMTQRKLARKRTLNQDWGRLSWFWISQIDVIPGFWATPWRNSISKTSCIGATIVILTALEAAVGKNCIRYVPVAKWRNRYNEWIFGGRISFPSYCHNSLGGIVAAGEYDHVRISPPNPAN
jgi:hypothetical protein